MDDYPKQYLYRQIVRAKLFIDGHYSSPIDLDRISESACFSKFHFVRLFRSVYRKTPHQYLTSVRIEKAEERLARGSSVKQACFAVGFESVSSFTSLFKRHKGMTPAEFQRARNALSREVASKPLKFVPNCFAEKKGWTKNSNFREIETVDRPARAAK